MVFAADSMLGRLARWLRVMGHDVMFQSGYDIGDLRRFSSEGRIVLSRKKSLMGEDIRLIFIRSDKVREQLIEVDSVTGLRKCATEWFSRCIECNYLLEKADPEGWGEGIPEYVFYNMRGKIRRCPACGRFFWPGSHRKRMEEQLKKWGF